MKSDFWVNFYIIAIILGLKYPKSIARKTKPIVVKIISNVIKIVSNII